MEEFIAYLFKKRRNHFYFLITIITLNILTAIQNIYAFNLLSVLIMPFWFIALHVDMVIEKENKSKS